MPTDAQVTPSEELFKTLSCLFETLDRDSFYISCQQGTTGRTEKKIDTACKIALEVTSKA